MDFTVNKTVTNPGLLFLMFGFRKSIPNAIKRIYIKALSAENQFAFQRNSGCIASQLPQRETDKHADLLGLCLTVETNLHFHTFGKNKLS